MDSLTAFVILAGFGTLCFIAHRNRPQALEYIDCLDIEDFGFEHRDDDMIQATVRDDYIGWNDG